MMSSTRERVQYDIPTKPCSATYLSISKFPKDVIRQGSLAQFSFLKEVKSQDSKASEREKIIAEMSAKSPSRAY